MRKVSGHGDGRDYGETRDNYQCDHVPATPGRILKGRRDRRDTRRHRMELGPCRWGRLRDRVLRSRHDFWRYSSWIYTRSVACAVSDTSSSQSHGPRCPRFASVLWTLTWAYHPNAAAPYVLACNQTATADSSAFAPIQPLSGTYRW